MKLRIGEGIKTNNLDNINLCEKNNVVNNTTMTNNDKMKIFVGVHYEITKQKYDKIHKDDFVDKYNKYYKTNITFANLLGDIKKFGLFYVSDFSVGGKKGVITGIKCKSNH